MRRESGEGAFAGAGGPARIAPRGRPGEAPAGVGPLLERFHRVTGLSFRATLKGGEGETVLHDSLGDGYLAGEDRVELATAEDGPLLRLEYVRGGEDARRAAELAAEMAARLVHYQREVRLFSRELVESYEQIHLLTSIGDVLGSVIQVDAAAETILDELVGVVEGERATLWRHDREGEELVPFVCRGRCGPPPGTPSFERERRVVGRVFSSQEALLLPPGKDGRTVPGGPGSGRPGGAGGDMDAGGSGGSGGAGTASVLCVPVTFAPEGGPYRRIGVLSVVGREVGPPFTAGDLRLLEAVASQIGTAIQNGHLVQESLQRERMLAELDIAHDLQLKLLPNLEGFSDLAEVAARCEPVHKVGGDFYLLIRLPAGRLGVMLGDVSSHGFSAALIMALTMSTAAIYAREEEEPAEVLYRVHRQLLRELESTEMYMTLFYGVLDGQRGRLKYANAGHPFAYRVTAGEVRRLEALDPPVGITGPARYGKAEAEWGVTADLLLLCTDGLATALAEESREAEEILSRVVAGAAGGGPHAVVEELFRVAAGREQGDDRTALAVRI